MAGLQPFNYGNVLANIENIKNAREQRNPNSLNNQYKQEQINALRNPQSGSNIGTVNPRDFTAESISAYGQSGNYDDLERYERMRPMKRGGVEGTLDDQDLI